MIVLWTLTGLAVALAGVMVLTAARRATGADEQAAPTATAELAELDRLRMRGLLDDDSWAAARAEAGRRLLAEPAPPMPLVIGRRDRTIALGALVATAAGSLGLYFVVGEPGLGVGVITVQLGLDPVSVRVDACVGVGLGVGLGVALGVALGLGLGLGVRVRRPTGVGV
jgi:cytochrome c-type biogenesis protein CcmI